MSVSSIVKVKHNDGEVLFDLESVLFITMDTLLSHIKVRFYSSQDSASEITIEYRNREDMVTVFHDLYARWKAAKANAKQAIYVQDYDGYLDG
mgnify:CR=1 FL=1